MSGPRRSIIRIAAVPLLLATGWTQVSAEDAKSDDNVDIAALARSIELDPKLSRCTVSKERSGKGLENLLTVLKDGKPPAVARAVYRWKQQRIAGETRKVPKFIFGSKSGSDKDAKIAIMSDEYDSVSWGPAFDDKGGQALYGTLAKAAENKDDSILEGKLDPMLTGLREALEVTGKDELVSWGQKFSIQDMAAVSQQVIATQEPQEAEIADGVKLEIGMQTFTTRQLYAYMHPVYDPDKNALSCDKLEDSLPVSTEYQLYVALTGIQEGESAELADAAEVAPGDEEAQGDADLAGNEIDNEIELAEGPQGEPAENQDVAALDEAGEAEGDEVAIAEEGVEGESQEVDSDIVEVDEKSYSSGPRRQPKKPYRAPRDDYYEEPVETIDYDPVYVVDDVEEYVDDWYDYPGYYDDYGYTEVYYEPLPPPIFIRPPIIVTPVISLFGGAIVFAAVAQPRWQRPWWNRPVAFARNRPNSTTININFIKPNRPKAFKPGWGLNQNRGFVQRKPKALAGKGRLIPAKATLGAKRKPGGIAGKPGLFKPKNANRIRNGKAAKKALAAKKAGRKFSPKGQKAGKNAAIAKRQAAARQAALAKKKAALAKQQAGKKGAAANKAAAKAKAAKTKAALAKKRAANKQAATKAGNKKALAAKNAAARKQAAKKAALAKQKAAAGKKAAGNKKAALARQKANAAKKAAAARQAAAKQKAAAGKRKAAANKAAAAKRAAQAKQNAAAKAAAARKNAQAKQRANQQAKQRANQQAKQRANQQAKQRAQQQAKQRAKQQANANKGPRPCPPGKRRVPGRGCI